jgi:hypothetical protein
MLRSTVCSRHVTQHSTELLSLFNLSVETRWWSWSKPRNLEALCPNSRHCAPIQTTNLPLAIVQRSNSTTLFSQLEHMSFHLVYTMFTKTWKGQLQAMITAHWPMATSSIRANSHLNWFHVLVSYLFYIISGICVTVSCAKWKNRFYQILQYCLFLLPQNCLARSSLEGHACSKALKVAITASARVWNSNVLAWD